MTTTAIPDFKLGNRKLYNDVNVKLYTDADMEKVQERLYNSIKKSMTEVTGTPAHSHGYATGLASGSYQPTTIGSYVWQGTGTGTSIYDGPRQQQDLGPSWQELMKALIEAAVKEVAKEVTETLKDLQEQIDEIWESLQDDE